MPTAAVTSVCKVDELIEVRRSRRARRWTLSVPWGSPPTLTIPAWMGDQDVDRIITTHREWIAAERSKQRPRLRLDPQRVSEADARTAVRELVAMFVEEEAPRIGVRPSRIQIRDQRSRWGSCSTRGTLSFNWRLVLAPLDVLDYVVVHELCHLRVPNHSRAFWALVEERGPHWREQRAWLREHGPELLALKASE